MTESPTGIGTIYTLAVWTVRPGNGDAFVEAWSAFARWTAEHQPGAMTGVLLRDENDPLRFISYGPWRDRESAEAWRKTPEFRESFARFRELCSGVEPHTMVCAAPSESAA